VSPSLDPEVFNFDKVFHRYGDPPAILTATFADESTVTVYVGPNSAVYSVVRDRRKTIINSRGSAQALQLRNLGILPQVAPLRSVEKLLEEDYVRACLDSALAPKHFRNQLFVFYDKYFADFKNFAEETWHGLRIEELCKRRQDRQQILELLVRNDDFVAEVSWMGDGLQMWLQTMWFLARSSGFESVILDEPDVYMHPDLQRKLIRLVRQRFPQVIVATHSVEIMAEVDPEQVLIVEKERRTARFAADLPEVQQIISHIGGIHNLQLARLANVQRCLFVEGDDLTILKRFQNTIFPGSDLPIDGIPHLSIGGWGGWTNVIGSSLWIANTMQGVAIYCILDSDYHTKEQRSARLAQAEEKNIRLKIWDRKELENYLLVPAAIQRLIKSLGRKGSQAPTLEAVTTKMEEIAEGLKSDTEQSIAQEAQVANRGHDVKRCMRAATEIVSEYWNTFGGKMSVVSGKMVLTELNRWTQQQYKVSFTNSRLASEIQADEIDDEVRSVLSAIEYGKELG
jgi:histone H3/H4/energy-coupling factor transporter ATP-binding protein EcfA2